MKYDPTNDNINAVTAFRGDAPEVTGNRDQSRKRLEPFKKKAADPVKNLSLRDDLERRAINALVRTGMSKTEAKRRIDTTKRELEPVGDIFQKLNKAMGQHRGRIFRDEPAVPVVILEMSQKKFDNPLAEYLEDKKKRLVSLESLGVKPAKNDVEAVTNQQAAMGRNLYYHQVDALANWIDAQPELVQWQKDIGKTISNPDHNTVVVSEKKTPAASVKFVNITNPSDSELDAYFVKSKVLDGLSESLKRPTMTEATQSAQKNKLEGEDIFSFLKKWAAKDKQEKLETPVTDGLDGVRNFDMKTVRPTGTRIHFNDVISGNMIGIAQYGLLDTLKKSNDADK